MLCLEPSLAGAFGRRGGLPSPARLRGVGDLLEDALDRELAVAELGAVVLSDCADERSEPIEDAAALEIGETRDVLDIEQGFDTGRALLRMLASRAARA